MFLYAFGYDAGADFVAGGGIQSGIDPLGPNLVTGHEERFAENFTFQIGTQIDGLGHVGVGPWFYNGNQAQDLASPTGLTALGNETMGPLATRGVILDIVGMKVAGDSTDDFFIAPNVVRSCGTTTGSPSTTSRTPCIANGFVRSAQGMFRSSTPVGLISSVSIQRVTSRRSQGSTSPRLATSRTKGWRSSLPTRGVSRCSIPA